MPIGLYHLRRWRPAGAGINILLSLSSGTFTRTTSGSYYDGSTSSIAWAVPNVLRMENRGDGYGALALIEGSTTNVVTHNQDLTQYTLFSASIGANTANAPDGTAVADRIDFSASIEARVNRQFGISPPNDINLICFWWVRSETGDQVVRLAMRQKDGVTWVSGSDETIGTSWKQITGILNCGSGATAPQFGLQNGSDGAARSVYAWGGQQDFFATRTFIDSTITTAAASVSRGADSLSFQTGSFPVNFLGSGSFEFDFCPMASSADIIAENATMTLLSAGSTDYIRLVNSAGTCRFQILQSNNIRLNQTVEFSKNQKCTVRIVANEGNTAWITGTFSNFTTGNGSTAMVPMSWPSSALYVGRRSDSPNVNFYGRISDFRP